MNYFDLAFAAFAILFVVIGACRGLVVSLLSLLRYVIGLPLSFFISDYFYRDFYNSYVKNAVYESVNAKLTETGSAENLLKSVNDFFNDIPEIFTKGIDISAFNGLTAEQISKSITDSVLEPIVMNVVKIAIFLVSFVVFSIIVGVLISVFSKLQKKKNMPLKRTNSLLGGVFGFVKAGLFTFTASTIIGYALMIISQDSMFAKQADSSLVLQFINSNNPLL